MNLYDKLAAREEKISVIGLGYVGLPLAIAFARHTNVIGYDMDAEKIALYAEGTDPTQEVGNEAVRETTMVFTAEADRLREALFHIVCVPSPVNSDSTPDLEPLRAASRTVGENLRAGSIVVYESTVYPGVTEDICVPILERSSGLKYGSDFTVGYSPERINPGDREHRLETIVKVVAASDEDSLEVIANVYHMVVKAGIYRSKSIREAEAAKVIENCQRNINIAFMNELSIIFDKMGIDTRNVLAAAATKWNFLNFHPGLVGGHCIGVDPYYLTYKAAELGYHPQIILAGMRINDGMGKHIAESIVKNLIKADITVKSIKLAILGFTFKENCPDIRNTKVIDVYNELKEYGINPIVVDPLADADEVKQHYGICLASLTEVRDMDAVVVAVAHEQFLSFDKKKIDALFNTHNQKKVLIDVKGIYDKDEFDVNEYLYWRL